MLHPAAQLEAVFMADAAGQLCEDLSSAITDPCREFDLVMQRESKKPCICFLQTSTPFRDVAEDRGYLEGFEPCN